MISARGTDAEKGLVAAIPDTEEFADAVVVVSDILSACLRGGRFTGLDATRIISKFEKIYAKVYKWVPEKNASAVKRCDDIVQDIVSKLNDAIYTYEGADVFTGDEAVKMIEAILHFLKLTYGFYTSTKPSSPAKHDDVVDDGKPTAGIASA
jgi:hypothetical protein